MEWSILVLIRFLGIVLGSWVSSQVLWRHVSFPILGGIGYWMVYRLGMWILLGVVLLPSLFQVLSVSFRLDRLVSCGIGSHGDLGIPWYGEPRFLVLDWIDVVIGSETCFRSEVHLRRRRRRKENDM
jgi:hypothetical protein